MDIEKVFTKYTRFKKKNPKVHKDDAQSFVYSLTQADCLALITFCEDAWITFSILRDMYDDKGRKIK